MERPRLLCRTDGSVFSATEDREAHQERNSNHSPVVESLDESISHHTTRSVTDSVGPQAVSSSGRALILVAQVHDLSLMQRPLQLGAHEVGNVLS